MWHPKNFRSQSKQALSTIAACSCHEKTLGLFPSNLSGLFGLPAAAEQPSCSAACLQHVPLRAASFLLLSAAASTMLMGRGSSCSCSQLPFDFYRNPTFSNTIQTPAFVAQSAIPTIALYSDLLERRCEFSSPRSSSYFILGSQCLGSNIMPSS